MDNNVQSLEPTMEETIPPHVIEKMKNQVKLLREGFVVHISDVTGFKDDSDYLTLKVTLLSEINRMSIFGDIEIKFAKQAIPRLKQHLSKVS